MHPLMTASLALAMIAAVPGIAMRGTPVGLSLSPLGQNILIVLIGLALCLEGARWWLRRRAARNIVLTLR